MYRLLARRWQSRLQAVLDEQRNGLSASSNAAGAITGATADALQELQQEALGILNDSSDDDSEEDEEDEEDDVSMMEQDEDEEADEHSDGLGHAAAAPTISGSSTRTLAGWHLNPAGQPVQTPITHAAALSHHA